MRSESAARVNVPDSTTRTKTRMACIWLKFGLAGMDADYSLLEIKLSLMRDLSVWRWLIPYPQRGSTRIFNGESHEQETDWKSRPGHRGVPRHRRRYSP